MAKEPNWTTYPARLVLSPTVTFWASSPTYFTPQHCTKQGFGDPTRADVRLPSHGHFPSIGGRYRWNEVEFTQPSVSWLAQHFGQLVHFYEPLSRQGSTTTPVRSEWPTLWTRFSILTRALIFFSNLARLPYELQTVHACNSKAKSFMVPSSFMTLTCGKLWRWTNQEVVWSWAGVIFTYHQY